MHCLMIALVCDVSLLQKAYCSYFPLLRWVNLDRPNVGTFVLNQAILARVDRNRSQVFPERLSHDINRCEI